MSQKFEIVSVMFTVLVTSILTISSAAAGDLIRTGRVRYCLPSYAYGDSKPKAVTIVDSAPAIRLDNVTLNQDRIQRSERRSTVNTEPGGTVTVSEVRNLQLANPVETTASHFVIPESTARYVTMRQPAAIAYASGDIHFSCILLHNGGKFGQLSGSRCRLRIQFLRHPGEFAEAGIAAPILHEMVREMYVASSAPLPVHVTKENLQEVERDFAELTQVRVHLECILDR